MDMAAQAKGDAELVSLRWGETSGVDHSANEEEGWLVMKANGQDDTAFAAELEAMLKRDEDVRKDADVLSAALDDIEKDGTLDGAPANVKAAAKTLADWCDQSGNEDTADSKPMTTRKDAVGFVQKLLQLARKATAGADLTADERKALADKGHAMPDGSYPIRNTDDLANAISSIGRAKDPAATKTYISRRAKELGATDKLPKDWSGSTQKALDAIAENWPTFVKSVIDTIRSTTPVEEKQTALTKALADLKNKVEESQK
jgi:hypothetical protein